MRRPHSPRFFPVSETLESVIKRSGRLMVKLSLGNCCAGCRRFGRSAQAESGSSRYQAKQHHGELGGERWRNSEDH